MSIRLHLCLRWSAAPPAVVPVVGLRPMTGEDASALGFLLWQGFASDPEDDIDSPEAAAREARATLSGRWGPVLWDCSHVVEVDGRVVAAAVVVADSAHGGLSQLAYLATSPDSRRLGYGTALVRAAVAGLHARGDRELHLAVVAGNPALSLYQRLGFTVQRT
jgi:ribosomal protein S18 acetylase RimI-like enzyme